MVTHTVTLRGAKLASRAGVDILVHGIGDAEVDERIDPALRPVGPEQLASCFLYHQEEAAEG